MLCQSWELTCSLVPKTFEKLLNFLRFYKDFSVPIQILPRQLVTLLRHQHSLDILTNTGKTRPYYDITATYLWLQNLCKIQMSPNNALATSLGLRYSYQCRQNAAMCPGKTVKFILYKKKFLPKNEK